MIKDPDFSWDGEFPYDALAKAGITPQATQDEVRRASFTLLRTRKMTPARQAAWDELRFPARRMVADFLLYDLDPDAMIAAAAQAARQNLADPGAATGEVRALSVTPDLWEDPDPGALLPPDAVPGAGSTDGVTGNAAFLAAAFPDDLITFDR